MPETWPFQPEADITETINYATDVLRAIGDESRVGLHDPYQVFQYRFVFNDRQSLAADGLIRANALGFWNVPVWSQAVDVGSVASSDTIIDCDTDAAFTTYAFIYQSDTEWTLAEIASIGVNQISLTGAVGADYQSALIAPVRSCVAPQGIQLSRIYADHVRASIEFRSVELVEDPATDFPQFSSADVVTDLTILFEEISGSVFQPNAVVDNGLGSLAVESVRTVIDGRYAMAFQDETMATKKRRRQWLDSIRGRDGEFWLSSRTRDFILVSPAVATDTTLTVEPVFYDLSHYDGRVLMISDGGLQYTTISSAALNGSNHDLTVTALTADAGTDAVISEMRKYRFDTDVIEIQHIRNSRAQVSIPVVEV